MQLNGGPPSIQVRDIAIHKHENDLVLGTFGRGISILDDYSPLRSVTPELMKQESALFPLRTAYSYLPAAPLGSAGKGFQGEAFWTAPNPPFGAVVTYNLKDAYRTTRQNPQKHARHAPRKKRTAPNPPPYQLRA